MDAIARGRLTPQDEVFVKRYQTTGVIPVTERRQVRYVQVAYDAEVPPQQVTLSHGGVSALICGGSPYKNCESKGFFAVRAFDGQSSYGDWRIRVYGAIRWLSSWKLIVIPVVKTDGTVAYRR